MKKWTQKVAAFGLSAALAASLAAPAFAANPTFSDMPENHWAYADVETVAEKGLMLGTGGGLFSPSVKVSVEQFLTMIGRVVFPDVTADGDDWSGPYLAAAQEGGLLEGTEVDLTKPQAEISRYDMAVIFDSLLLNTWKLRGIYADPKDIPDYEEMPRHYRDSVTHVYGRALIRGDQNGNFNGSNTMTRAEVATVLARLVDLRDNPPPRYDPDYDPDAVELVEGDELRIDISGFPPYSYPYLYLKVGDVVPLTVCEVPAGYGHTKEDVTWTSDHESVATVDENGMLTAVGTGSTLVSAAVPVIEYGRWSSTLSSIIVYVDP